MPEDPYVYPGTSVLRNRLGVRDPAALAAPESRLSALADAELAAEPMRGSFDLAHLQAIHRALFSDVYDWAGELRTVAIAKADIFCLPQHIESYAGDIFGRLGRERHLAGLGREQFVGRLSVYLGDVIALHAFREGNGRAQRAFFTQLAREAGYRLDWSGVDPARNVSASISAMRGLEAPLRELLGEITTPLPAKGGGEAAVAARTAHAAYPKPPAARRPQGAPEGRRGADPPSGRGRGAQPGR